VSDVKVGSLVSDHHLIMFKLDVKRQCLDSELVPCRQWRKLSLSVSEADLCASCLLNLPESQLADLSSDELADIYHSEMTRLIHKHCSVIKHRRKRGLLTPWFDTECRASRRRSRMLEREISVVTVGRRLQGVDTAVKVMPALGTEEPSALADSDS